MLPRVLLVTVIFITIRRINDNIMVRSKNLHKIWINNFKGNGKKQDNGSKSVMKTKRCIGIKQRNNEQCLLSNVM